MMKTKTRTVVAALCGVLMAGPALANACLRPEERAAIEIRALRSYLMVAALQMADEVFKLRAQQADLAARLRSTSHSLLGRIVPAPAAAAS